MEKKEEQQPLVMAPTPSYGTNIKFGINSSASFDPEIVPEKPVVHVQNVKVPETVEDFLRMIAEKHGKPPLEYDKIVDILKGKLRY